MKLPALLILPALAAFSLTSCVVPAYNDPGAAGSVGVSYESYAVLPSHYVGDAYYYGGRYYSGGRYESGRFYDHGRAYSDRYYHNGQYYYGGRHESHGSHESHESHESHGNGGSGRYDGHNYDPRDHSGDRESSWQPAHSGPPAVIRRY